MNCIDDGGNEATAVLNTITRFNPEPVILETALPIIVISAGVKADSISDSTLFKVIPHRVTGNDDRIAMNTSVSQRRYAADFGVAPLSFAGADLVVEDFAFDVRE